MTNGSSVLNPVTHGEVLVAGGGPAGLASALALVRAGVAVTLVTPAARAPQTARTVALFEPSMTLLTRLGVARRLPHNPITGIRLIDDMGGLLRAPEVTFRASDIGRACFGHNIPNSELEAALRAALAEQAGPLTWIDGASVTALDLRPDTAKVTLSNGQVVTAAVVVAADGRESLCRKAAGISVRTAPYEQAAVTARFTHSRPHGGVSSEFHRPPGPCTTVPLPGNASSLVWVERPERAQELVALPEAEFRAALEERLQGLLGAIGEVSPRGMFPLTWIKAETEARRRVLLVGEAAHVFPPIGAQGLNLGLRDVAQAVDCISEAHGRGGDMGGEDVMASYRHGRGFDIASRMAGVDALNRSLLMNLMPVNLARGLGLQLVGAMPMLRRQVIALGMHPPGELPRLMQPDINAA